MKKIKQLASIFLLMLPLTGIITLQGCSSTPHSESSGQYIDNSAITLKVKTKLLADKSIKSFPITVNSYKNTVQLSGFVNTRHQKEKAEAIAYSIKGVESVKNDLIVKQPSLN
jgi:osmotically-inducible protein OsmY